MKNFKFLFLGIAVAFLSACSNQYTDLNRDSDTLTGSENTGGYVQVAKPSIAYVVGNGNTFSYGTNVTAFQSNDKIAKVEVYSQFTSVAGASPVKSNTVLLKTLTYSGLNQSETIANNFNYNELRAGIVVNGTPLSVNDTTLAIGDYWTLTYITTTASGKVSTNVDSTKVSVSTRLAGTYRCVSGVYYRIGVLTYTTTDWPSETVIESVNTTTYRVKKYFGPFNNTSVPTGGDYYFSVDNAGVITYPATVPGTTIAQLGNGQPFITCTSHPSEMTLVNCGSSNFVTLNNITGKDRLTMSFAYLNGPGLARQFYQVMEKL
jgi:hypothetical protein